MPPPVTARFGSVMATITRVIPAWMIASLHGGVLP